jgi:hypothetical protein
MRFHCISSQVGVKSGRSKGERDTGTCVQKVISDGTFITPEEEIYVID